MMILGTFVFKALALSLGPHKSQNASKEGISAMTARERVQKHRARLQEKNCCRFELWVGRTVLHDLKLIAHHRGLSLRQILHEALEQSVTRYEGVLSVMKRHPGHTVTSHRRSG